VFKLNKELLLIIVLFIAGCGILKTMDNISRLKYKIHSADNYQLLGINLKNKKSINDFTPVEVLKITSSLIKGNLPITFTIKIEARNPNDGQGGFPRTDLTIESFPWQLYINDKEIVAGNIDEAVFVPGKGETTIIPLTVEFDIVKNIKEKNIDDIVNFIQLIGGLGGSTSNLKITTKPIIGTPIGKINYPDIITIVDKEFN